MANMQDIGLGCRDYNFAVYIANKPNVIEYADLDTVTPMAAGEIYSIGQACGNGWRKVFNVYAKLVFALPTDIFSYVDGAESWQQFRDKSLLQQQSKLALLFSPPYLTKQNCIHIICGRTYAKQLLSENKLNCQLTWLDNEFAIDKSKRLIVCPYFDYRQLSNSKIIYLISLIKQLAN